MDVLPGKSLLPDMSRRGRDALPVPLRRGLPAVVRLGEDLPEAVPDALPLWWHEYTKKYAKHKRVRMPTSMSGHPVMAKYEHYRKTNCCVSAACEASNCRGRMVDILTHEHILASPLPRLLLSLVQLPKELSARSNTILHIIKLYHITYRCIIKIYLIQYRYIKYDSTFQI